MNTDHSNQGDTPSIQAPSPEQTGKPTGETGPSYGNRVLIILVLMGAVILLVAIFRQSAPNVPEIPEGAVSGAQEEVSKEAEGTRADTAGGNESMELRTDLPIPGEPPVKFSRDVANEFLLYKPREETLKNKPRPRHFDLKMMREVQRNRRAQGEAEHSGDHGGDQSTQPEQAPAAPSGQ